MHCSMSRFPLIKGVLCITNALAVTFVTTEASCENRVNLRTALPSEINKKLIADAATMRVPGDDVEMTDELYSK